MFISIIIPTLNEEQHIGKLLDFLIQHPQNKSFEVIVADGGSNDQTCQIVEDRNIQMISTSTSRAHQMNVGAQQAKGDVLHFVHADTMLVDSFVDDIQNAINQGFKCGCYRFKFNKPQNPLLHINGFFTRFPFTWCRGGDQTLFIERETFENLKGFSERFVIMEDYDLLDRISDNNIPFTVLPKSVMVSARKYNKNSYLKVQLANLKAMKMYKKGVEPEKIKKYYIQKLG